MRKAKGKPLTKKQLDARSVITARDVKLAIDAWRRAAPARFRGLLDARAV